MSQAILGVALPASAVQGVSDERSVSKSGLIVVFRQCEAYRYRDVGDADWGKLLEPVVPKQYRCGVAPMYFEGPTLATRGKSGHVGARR